MARDFDRTEAEALLVSCHRRCCICHRFCGVKIELDHIVPRSKGGGDAIDNALPVCFECHAEIHAYNADHPRGRRFTPSELRGHKEQWMGICATRPELLVGVARNREVGPLQALIDELEFNLAVAKQVGSTDAVCGLMDAQFKRAIQQGAVSLLQDELRLSILAAYVAIGRANQAVEAYQRVPHGTSLGGTTEARTATQAVILPVEAARCKLLEFLGTKPRVGV